MNTRFSSGAATEIDRALDRTRFVRLDEDVLDSRQILFKSLISSVTNVLETLDAPKWNGDELQFKTTKNSAKSLDAFGFYEKEEWGAWSRISEPFLVLPVAITGLIVMDLQISGYGNNVGTTVRVNLGSSMNVVRLDSSMKTVEMIFRLDYPSRVLRFSGIDSTESTLVADSRSMGLAISSVRIQKYAGRTFQRTKSRDTFFTGSKNMDVGLVGFYPPETWGAWSAVENPIVVLPFEVVGLVSVEFFAQGGENNIGRNITVSIGDSNRVISLEIFPQKFILHLLISEPTNTIVFSGLNTESVVGSGDHRSLGIGVHSILLTQTPIAVDPWDGLPVSLATAFGTDPEMHLVGFYPPETWGAWSETTNPVVILPFALHGRIALDLEIVGYGPNVGRTIFVQMGDQQVEIVLSASAQVVTLEFNLQEPSRMISFRDVIAESLLGAADLRTMGIGLSNVKVAKSTAIRSWRKKLLSLRENLPDIEKLDISMDGASIVDPHTLELKGIVYVAFLTTTVDSSEWKDVVTAFCWACKDVSLSTLLISVPENSDRALLELAHEISRIGEMKCRVIVLPKNLDSESMKRILNVADFYVHVPSSLPAEKIIEIARIPAIVSSRDDLFEFFPRGSQISSKSTIQPLPIAGHKTFVQSRLYERADWGQIADAFRYSFEIISTDPNMYEFMLSAAKREKKDVL